uniref:hypothetical protein n=1 Tax=Daedaleopsis nitida TaxID=1140402 RepID=UPI0030E4E366
MILKIRKLFRIMLNHYYQVVRLETGFRVSYLPFIFFILIICISSIFIRINVINEINNKYFLKTLLFFGLCNIIFLQFNFGCRLTITIGKGIPYFIREIKSKKNILLYYYFTGFILYNLSLLILTFFVLFRLY